MLDFILPAAWATNAKSSGAGFDFMSFIPLIAIMIVFYFLVIRPQQKKQGDIKDMLASLKRGDNVITTGGLIGKISRVLDENRVMLSLGDDIEVQVAKSAITEKVDKSFSGTSQTGEGKPSPRRGPTRHRGPARGRNTKDK